MTKPWLLFCGRHTSHLCNGRTRYATACEGAEFDNIVALYQVQQDMMVVHATSNFDAIYRAAELLEAQCEYTFVITQAASAAEMDHDRAPLGRVERGTVPAASLADEDRLVWAECFVYWSEEPDSPRRGRDARTPAAIPRLTLFCRVGRHWATPPVVGGHNLVASRQRNAGLGGTSFILPSRPPHHALELFL